MSGGPVPLPAWEQLAEAIPGIAALIRRYLQQIGCVLRPHSVENADQALRLFAAFLAEQAPGTGSLDIAGMPFLPPEAVTSRRGGQMHAAELELDLDAIYEAAL